MVLFLVSLYHPKAQKGEPWLPFAAICRRAAPGRWTDMGPDPSTSKGFDSKDFPIDFPAGLGAFFGGLTFETSLRLTMLEQIDILGLA